MIIALYKYCILLLLFYLLLFIYYYFIFIIVLCVQIVKMEKLRSDLSTLLALCEKADNDIRSCLNTLQVGHEGTTWQLFGSIHQKVLT